MRITARTLLYGIAVICGLGVATPALAQISTGTWVQQKTPEGKVGLEMTVESCCSGGLRLIYRLPGRSDVLLSVESPMDGRDAPVLMTGQPTGETMGMKRVDDHHVMTVLKMNGQQFGTSKATLSPDGTTLTIENEITATAAGRSIGKSTEVWVKKK
jgi:hypothetical protein